MYTSVLSTFIVNKVLVMVMVAFLGTVKPRLEACHLSGQINLTPGFYLLIFSMHPAS